MFQELHGIAHGLTCLLLTGGFSNCNMRNVLWLPKRFPLGSSGCFSWPLRLLEYRLFQQYYLVYWFNECERANRQCTAYCGRYARPTSTPSEHRSQSILRPSIIAKLKTCWNHITWNNEDLKCSLNRQANVFQANIATFA